MLGDTSSLSEVEWGASVRRRVVTGWTKSGRVVEEEEEEEEEEEGGAGLCGDGGFLRANGMEKCW